MTLQTDIGYSESDEKLIVKTSQDVEPLLALNKAEYNDSPEFGKSGNMRKVASIPNVIIHKWLTEEGIDFFNREHWPRVQQKLNSPEYRYLRTAPGRI